MEFSEYQHLASETDQYPNTDQQEAIQIPLLGLVGEVGSLITNFKKRIRDKESYEHFIPQVKEELGDVLWYLSNLSTKLSLSLNEIAENNLDKNNDRWPSGGLDRANYKLYDEDFPEKEQLPRNFCIEFNESNSEKQSRLKITLNGEQIGDTLTDNAYEDDGYRYHDAFHLAYAAILGWSPVLRMLNKCKRKSDATIDEVEDGARAIILEEAISLYIYSYANKHHFLENVSEIDQNILYTIRGLVSGLEVANRTTFEWKVAILKGYEVYRLLRSNQGGKVEVDLVDRNITYIGKPRDSSY